MDKFDKNFLDNVFDVKDRTMSNGSWWWWFWLFFIKNPENPSKPKQLMILWSTKNDESINCNDKKIKISELSDKMNMDGAVAVWYFNGNEMEHNYLLGECKLDITDKGLKTEIDPSTMFSVKNGKSIVKIGEDFEFRSTPRNSHKFESLDSYEKNIIGDKGYSMMRMNRMDLEGTVKGQSIEGSSYFQRVFVNAPAVPWYWGIFHFENGGSLSYFNPHFLGKSVKEDISFYDGNKFHKFDVINVERIGKDSPEFIISGEDDYRKIEFTVSSYSHSSWTFRKKMLKFIPNKLVYNEYPSKITNFKFIDKRRDMKITDKDLGDNVGNAEHTKGFLS